MRVYIAGPYTKGDVSVNVGKAMKAFNALMNAGFTPFIPHLNHFIHMHEPRAYESWMKWDLEWLKSCDAVYRLRGESPGADREVEKANNLGIPVFHEETDGMVYLVQHRNNKE